MQGARTAWSGRGGFADSYERDRVGAILHSTSFRFRRALTYPDTVLVGAAAREVGGDRFVHDYRLLSVSRDAIAAEGTGVIVSFDYENRRKAPIPDRVRVGIDAVEDEEGGDCAGPTPASGPP